MLLVSFTSGDACRIGVLDRAQNEIVDLSRAAPALPQDMLAFIALGAEGLDAARAALAASGARLPLAEVRLLAPIPRPARNIMCIGKNYRDHANEVKSLPAGGSDLPEHPIVFTKAPSTVIGPEAPIPSHLDASRTTDYEGELGVIIGRGGRGIAREAAMEHVYGYTVLNDVTARGLQKRHLQWFIGKSIDGFCPMGPALLTADEVPDVRALRIQTRINGELRQNSCVEELIFDIPTLIETLSAGMTLEPGDVIATGTPAGVGAGFTPPKYLQPGDRVAITIDPIGTLENPVE
jgi:2-keto-4-pentenoate hydratase/2-oxohepta-3-ene-1,7-dioic acid hydratase in catechol pathway